MPESGEYTFTMNSDDAAMILIDGKAAIADKVKHKTRTATHQVTLEKGKKSIEIHFFQHTKKMTLELNYTTPSGKMVKLEDWKLTF